MSSAVTVTRTSADDIQHRQIILSIDGKPFATLMYGQSATFPVMPGHHKIKANNTLVWKTLEFDLAEGEHARFSVVNIAGRWSFPLITVLGVGPVYLRFEKTPEQ